MRLNLWWLFVLTSACTLRPTSPDDITDRYPFVHSSVSTTEFQHQIFSRPDSIELAQSSRRLHIYIEGDGTPWIRGRYVARDPTPNNPNLLRLMSIDENPAIYLGRPCYFRFDEDDYCDTRYWTSHRYSKKVVGSLAAAVRQLIRDDQSLVLIGHSGGGTLAVLLAESLLRQGVSVEALVTLAANLDIDAWTTHHGYRALDGSLNPAELSALPASLRQIHLQGALDRNVPPQTTAEFFRRQPTTQPQIYPNQSHSCCWHEIWPEVLGSL